jgi:hypothetical protein
MQTKIPITLKETGGAIPIVRCGTEPVDITSRKDLRDIT